MAGTLGSIFLMPTCLRVEAGRRPASVIYVHHML